MSMSLRRHAGPASTMRRTTSSWHRPAPASSVSATCRSKLSSAPITQEMPPWACAVFASSSAAFVTSSTRPWPARPIAAIAPAMPLPTTR